MSPEYIVCPTCGEKHKDCSDWVKSMPHKETCSCGAQMLCWFETEVTYHAEVFETGEIPKKKAEKGKTKKRKKSKDATSKKAKGHKRWAK
jgi:hypothetical protein